MRKSSKDAIIGMIIVAIIVAGIVVWNFNFAEKQNPPHYQLNLGYDGNEFKLNNLTLSNGDFKEEYGDYHVNLRLFNGSIVIGNSFKTQYYGITEGSDFRSDNQTDGNIFYENRTEIVIDVPYSQNAMSLEIWDDSGNILFYEPLH